jgi:hypothetical protein
MCRSQVLPATLGSCLLIHPCRTAHPEATTCGSPSPARRESKLAALVPKPRTNLTRFHGVFASNSKFRVRVTPAKRGSGRKRRQPTGGSWLDKTPAERHASMTWMQRLKRVFNIDIETCERCSGQVKIIACIEDPAVIERILAHLKGKEPSADLVMLPEGRGPPQARLFD